jgi:hypothetical protein
MPRTGSSVGAIYERTPAAEAMVERGLIHPNECVATLGEVITDLSLKVLSSDDEQRIRNELGLVIGSGLSNIEYSPKLNPDGRLQVRDIQKTLRGIAAELDASWSATGHKSVEQNNKGPFRSRNRLTSQPRHCGGAPARGSKMKSSGVASH